MKSFSPHIRINEVLATAASTASQFRLKRQHPIVFVPALTAPKQKPLGEFRRSKRTPAEREANVARYLKSECDGSGVIRHNSLRKLILWRSPAKGWFQKATENIWTAQ
jgi:hypothetical protein